MLEAGSPIQLVDFFENLAHKPYCADELLYGLKIRPKETAIKMQYIQGNQPCMVHYFFFDIDYSDAVWAWFDANLPMPYWTAQTQKNAHAHICYKLKTPVCTSNLGRKKAIYYAAKVQAALATKLGADVSYSHLITKNPCHENWRVTFWSEKAYELDYLADFVDLPKTLSKEQAVLGLGRNCTLFDIVRNWAYKAVREHRGGNYTGWLKGVEERCWSVNNEFLNPLPYSEVKAIAKSIAKFCWDNDARCHQKFIQRQSCRGKAGAAAANAKGACAAGGVARSQQYSDMRQEALKLHILGLKPTQIAKKLGVSRPTIYNWVKKISKSVKVPS